MKNYIFLLIALVAISLPSNVNAQAAGNPVKVWTDPVIYAYDEPVTWYFDMSGSSFTVGMDLYLWTWAPSEPDAGNGGNSSDFAKLDYVGDMVWKKTLTPTLYYGLSAEEITAKTDIFWMNLKDKKGTISTNTIHVIRPTEDIVGFAGSGKAAQIFPAKFYLNEPLSLLINAKEVLTDGVKGGLVGQPSIHLHSGLNGFQAGTIVEANMGNPELFAKTKFKDLGNDIYKIDLIPSQYYGVASDFVMEDISFVLASKDWVKVGKDAGNKDFLFRAPGVPVPPDPVLYIFPKKFSQKDIFSIVRTNNEKNVSKLTYTVTAGDKTLTGDFAGLKADLRAYINLNKELTGVASLNKIHVVVKDNNDRVILDTDIALVQLSEIE